MREFGTDRQFLEEIEAWLTFNIEPTKEDLIELRRDLNKHIGKANPLEQLVRHKTQLKEDNVSNVCEWLHTYPTGEYATNCGEIFILSIGTIEENSYNFCPNCGKRVKEQTA